MHAGDNAHQTRGLTYVIGRANTYLHLWKSSQLEGWYARDLVYVVQATQTLEFCYCSLSKWVFPLFIWKNPLKELLVFHSLLCLLCQSHRLFVTPRTVACQAPLSTGIPQARILEWVAMPSFRGSPQSRDRTQPTHITGRFFTVWATREVQEYQSR